MLHLIHPILVHFSVALLVVGASSEAWGLLRRSERPHSFGAALVLAGTISLVPTIAAGFLAVNSVSLTSWSEPVAGRHEQTGLLVLAAFLASQFWKGWVGGRIPESQRVAYAALLIAGVALVVYGAFLGGELVYVHGVGVALDGARGAL